VHPLGFFDEVANTAARVAQSSAQLSNAPKCAICGAFLLDTIAKARAVATRKDAARAVDHRHTPRTSGARKPNAPPAKVTGRPNQKKALFYRFAPTRKEKRYRFAIAHKGNRRAAFFVRAIPPPRRANGAGRQKAAPMKRAHVERKRIVCRRPAGAVARVKGASSGHFE
jgi:hypothetical protein